MNTRNYTVSYASTRAEVWRTYWREWARPAGLWRFQLLIGIAVGFAAADRGDLSHFSGERFAVMSLAATGSCLLLFPLLPQLRFKPQTCVLTLDADGFKTTIGSRSGERRWRDIRRIEEHDANILILEKNGNAMIISRRAFATDADRQGFLESAKAWHVPIVHGAYSNTATIISTLCSSIERRTE